MKLLEALRHAREVLLEISTCTSYDGIGKRAGFGFVETDSSKLEMPVLRAYAILDKDGTVVEMKPSTIHFCGSLMPQEEFTDKDVQLMDRNWPNHAPHTKVKLYSGIE